MQKVAIIGVSGTIGLRVAAALVERGFDVVGIDVRPPANVAPSVAFHLIDLVGDDAASNLKLVLRGVDTLVDLAAVLPAHRGGESPNLAMARRVLAAAGDAGVGALVVMSSAAVYGAWPDNPVPLTEDSPLRPNPGFEFAAEKGEIESLANEWRDGHPGATVAVLRPAPVLGRNSVSGWLAKVTRPAWLDRLSADVRPLQYVHVDDVAEAIVHTVVHGLDGVFNVAPDGWVTGDEAAALLGPTSPIPIPDGFVEQVRRLSRAGTAPGSTSHGRHPWVVANDRLKATGWRPASTTQETLVAAKPPGRLEMVFARHRQEITLGAVVLGAAGLVGGAFGAWRWWRRRH